MRYFPGRARRKVDIALLLKVCPECLGDLVFESDFSGEFYRCLQCNTRMEPKNHIGRIREYPHPFDTDASDVFPTGREPKAAAG